MRILWTILALCALSSAPAWAGDLEAQFAECKAFEAEKASLLTAGIAADMEKGPEWAAANLPAARLEQIKRFIEIDEQLKFRCPDVYASSALKAEEEKARQQAREAQLWEERLAQSAKNPPLPERKPIIAVARAKQGSEAGPPLPVRATR